MTAEDLGAKLVAMVAARAAGRPVLLVGIAGGVAVGKSTLAGAIADGLGPATPVQIVATDGFLKPNSALADAGLVQKKGFPETYDVAAFHGFLDALAEGRSAVTPVYSHSAYDIVPGETRTVTGAGVVIVEGVNVLQTAAARARFGLSVYVDAAPKHIKAWYLARLERIIATEPQSLIAQIPDVDLRNRLIEQAWTEINLVNLRDHIAPTAAFADVVVRKDADHAIAELVVR
jgi:type I pantothenate kinase